MVLASSAITATIFPVGSGRCTMLLKRQMRCTSQNPTFMLASTTKKGYTKVLNIARSKESPIIDPIVITIHEYQREQAVKRIKEIMASKLRERCHVEALIMIDAIQRLGLEYYFQDDIQATLEKHNEMYSMAVDSDDNLHDAALRFRLLRQHGYDVSADTFNKFKDKDGKFNEKLRKDMIGLVSLFEASQLSMPGEHILDHAGEFSWHLLDNLRTVELEQSEARIVGNTLRNPYHRSLPRLTVKSFLHDFKISLKLFHDFNDKNKWINEVQDLARIDINMAQVSHQNEITQSLIWWKELRLTEELKLARNQPVKWHLWSMAIIQGPNKAEQRLELTKVVSLIYIIDDIFDVYGTLEDLTLFTEAVNRWEYANVKGLPNYMTMCLRALHEITNEMSHKIYIKHGWDPTDCLRKVWGELCNAYLEEAKWLAFGDMPTTEEYLKNRTVSTGVNVVCIHIFILLAEGLNDKSPNLFNTLSNIASPTATIFRLWNDIGSADVNPNGQDWSFIACYINEHKSSSAECAQEFVHKVISDSWKCLNEACLSRSFPAEFKAAMLNLARMAPLMYINDDNKFLSSPEEYMHSCEVIAQE